MQVKCLPVLSPGELLAQRKQASRNEPAAAALDADLDLDLDDVLEDTPQLRKLRQIREHSIAARGGSTSGRLLSIGDHGASNNPETELYWQGTTLVWSRGASVVRTFTFDENVNQACWAWLDLGCADRPQRLGKLTNTEGLNGQSDLASMAGAGSPNPLHATQASSTPFSPAQRQMRVRTSPQADAGMVNDAKLERALCVFLERVLVIYLPFSGDEHTLPLPFKLKQAMPMTVGLLIQRDTETGDLKLASETVSDPNRGPTILAELTELQNADGPATEQEGAPTAEVAQPLPTVFSLRRPFDEFRPVSRVAQISQETSSVRDSAVDAHGSNSPPERTRTLLHGNPSHMSDVEEVIVFVADGSPIAPLPVIVSVNVPARCVRIYAYADGSGEVASVPLAAAAELSPTEEISQSARGGESQVSQMGLDLTGFASASTRAIGRGRPPPRKSARLEMQRRTSGFGAASGRDRSKRISSMHGGDLRIVSRQEAPDGPAGSSQYRDDMADFVEGLTRPPDQEEAGNASVRPSGASTRARRPSDNLHRTRTPYGPPRTVSRQPSTAARQPSTAARGRPSVSRPDMSMNYDPMSLGMGSATQPARAAFDLRMQEAQFSSAEADGERLNMDGLADTNQYAAHVSILEDIEIPELDSPEKAAQVTAFFVNVDTEAPLLYISVPCASTLLAREVLQKRISPSLTGPGGKVLSTHRPPQSRAAVTYPAVSAVAIDAAGPLARDVLMATPDGSLVLMHGPPGDAGAAIPLSLEKLGMSDESPSHLSRNGRLLRLDEPRGSVVTLHFENVKVSLHLDLSPRCETTRRVLDALRATMPAPVARTIRTDWIERRFGFVESQESGAAVDDWQTLVRVLTGESSARQKHPILDDPWSALLSSTSHASYKDDPCLPPLTNGYESPGRSDEPAKIDAGLPPEHLAVALASIHLVAQDARLDMTMGERDLGRLAELLVGMAARLGNSDWADYWFRLVPDSATKAHLPSSPPRDAPSLASPPDVLDLLAACLKGRTRPRLSDLIPNASKNSSVLESKLRMLCPLTSKLFDVFASFSHAPSEKEAQTDGACAGDSARIARVRSVVETMDKVGLGLSQLARLPFGVALPLREALRSCQLDPPASWSARAYRLVDRADLAKQISPKANPRWLRDGVMDRRYHSHPLKTLPKTGGVDPISAVLFSENFRLRDVVKMLQTSDLTSIRLPERHDKSEQEIKEEQTRLLQGVLLRKLATPIGRAMLTLASRPFKVTEKWQMPPVNLGVRTVPHGSVIAEPPAHMMGELDWPEFHNGVASALQIASGPHHIDSNWVFSHYQPEEPSARHAGFLFGIGLMGHLTSLGRVHAFKYLYPRHGLTTIGTILGLAASFVGTGDPTARQLMAIQVSAFLPEGSAPLNLSTLTQTAGLLGMGMVFMGSYHRWTAERMLQQIGAKELQTSNDQLYMRENYSLSAGMALGMIMLGKGRRDPMTSTQDKLMIAQLQGLMVGKAESFSEDDIPTGTPMLDVSTTSISATIALGLIFLGSNRLDIAEMVEIPETIRGLDFVRPDVLLVRILARHLILWDRIQPSDEWLEVSLPNVIRRVRASGRAMGEAAQLAYYNMRAGACFALALKYAGSGNLEAKKCLMRQLKSFSREAGVRAINYFTKVRQSALRSGADLLAVSVAMVMAGTGDVDLLRYLRIAHGNCDHQTSFGTHMATHMALGMLFLGGGRFTLGSSDSAVAALLVAFFPRFQTAVHDNRAHLQACRHLWVLAVEPRLLVAEDVDSHEVSYLPVKVMHTDPENNDVSSVASHEIKTPALLPYFQSIRSLETVSLRYWPASLQVSTNTAHAKALLSMRTMFVKRKTGHLSYADDPKGNRSIFARSSAAAMFDIDMTTSARNGPSLTDLRDLVHGFPMAPQYAAFVERICSPSKRSNSDENGQAFQSFCTSVLMECLTQDKPALVPIYLALYLGREGGTSAQGSAMFLRDLEFAAGFYASDYERLIPAGSSERHKPLVQKVLLDNLLLASKGLAKEIMHSPDVAAGDLSSMSAHSALLAYLGEALGDTLAAAKALSPTSSSPSSDRANSNTVARQLAYILNVERVPSLETLRSLRTLVTEARSQSLKLTTEAGGLGAHDDPSALDEGIRLVVRLAVMNLEKESSQDSVGVGEKSVAIEPQPWTNRLLDEMLKLWQ